MISLSKERRLKASFNMGAKLEVYYTDNGIGSWMPYNGKGFPLEDLDDIRIDVSVQYVVLDSVVEGLTYGIFPSGALSRFIKPYYVGTFDKCFDWVLENTKWNGKTKKLFEMTYISPSEKIKPTANWVVYKDENDVWHSTIEPNYDGIKHKPDVEMVCKGSKENCEKKVKEHNSKFYVKLEDDTCVVYKDEIGVYHIESIHKFIIDEDYRQLYIGSYKECQAFIAGASESLSKDWFVTIDEFGYEIICGEREPNTLVVYEGSSQECSDFTKGFKSWEEVLASFVKTLEERNIPVDIHELTIRHLKVLARRISGVEINEKDIMNCPILNLLVKYHFINIDCQTQKCFVRKEA